MTTRKAHALCTKSANQAFCAIPWTFLRRSEIKTCANAGAGRSRFTGSCVNETSPQGHWHPPVMRSLNSAPAPSEQGSSAMAKQRRRFKQLLSLGERLDQEAARLRAQAREMPPGPEREAFEAKARQAEAATRIDEW